MFTALGQQLLADEVLKLGYSDYTGITSDDEGVDTRTITFEPDGIDASSGWVLDPYLVVDESATLIKVHCDGYWVELDKTPDEGDRVNSIYSDDYGTILPTFNSGRIVVPGTAYYFDQDADMQVIENTSIRVVTRVVGTFKASGTPLSDVAMTKTYFIYSDRIIIWDRYVYAAEITLADSSRHFFIGSNNMTNAISVAEAAAAETLQEYPADATDYFGTISDEISYIVIPIFNNFTAVNFSFYNVGNTLIYRWASTSAAGTYDDIYAILFDSPDRDTLAAVDDAEWDAQEYGLGDVVTHDTVNYESIQAANENKHPDTEPTWWRQIHLYTVAQRLAMGDQYKDTTMADPSGSGGWVTNLSGDVVNVGVDGFGSDGAWHVNGE